MKFSESLKKNKDFRKVYRKGTSAANRLIVMYVLKNGMDINRLGVSVSKKVGNSVVRHRLTRLVRESYRLNENKFKCGYDLVIVIRPASKGRKRQQMDSAMIDLASKHHIIDHFREDGDKSESG